jgi:hypothetical protein
MIRRLGLCITAAAAVLLSAPASAASDTDANNPTCPKQLNWSTYRQMRFTLEPIEGVRVLKAEGMIDEGVPYRLQEALKANAPIDEIWIALPAAMHAQAMRRARLSARRRCQRGFRNAGRAFPRAISCSWAARSAMWTPEAISLSICSRT